MGRWGTACAPSTRTRAPAAWAISVIARIGFAVPSTLETWVIATSLVRLPRWPNPGREASLVARSRRSLLGAHGEPVGDQLFHAGSEWLERDQIHHLACERVREDGPRRL